MIDLMAKMRDETIDAKELMIGRLTTNGALEH